MTISTIIAILIFIVVSLIAFPIIQIKLAGMKVKDFWSFIGATQMLDKLYKASKQYSILSTQEQIIFLQEAEKVFDAFDKVPSLLWEEEYSKYVEVLNTYKDIRVLRWSTAH